MTHETEDARHKTWQAIAVWAALAAKSDAQSKAAQQVAARAVDKAIDDEVILGKADLPPPATLSNPELTELFHQVIVDQVASVARQKNIAESRINEFSVRIRNAVWALFSRSSPP